MNSIVLALVIAIISSGILAYVLRNYEFKGEQDGFHGVERIFVWLQVITAAYVAFAHGANDRSNAIGPMAAGTKSSRVEENWQPRMFPLG